MQKIIIFDGGTHTGDVYKTDDFKEFKFIGSQNLEDWEGGEKEMYDVKIENRFLNPEKVNSKYLGVHVNILYGYVSSCCGEPYEIEFPFCPDCGENV